MHGRPSSALPIMTADLVSNISSDNGVPAGAKGAPLCWIRPLAFMQCSLPSTSLGIEKGLSIGPEIASKWKF